MLTQCDFCPGKNTISVLCRRLGEVVVVWLAKVAVGNSVDIHADWLVLAAGGKLYTTFTSNSSEAVLLGSFCVDVFVFNNDVVWVDASKMT